MGMFDSIMIKFKCPYCNKIAEHEFQTKIGDCSLGTYRMGDKFSLRKDFIRTREHFHEILSCGSCRAGKDLGCGTWLDASIYLDEDDIIRGFQLWNYSRRSLKTIGFTPEEGWSIKKEPRLVGN